MRSTDETMAPASMEVRVRRARYRATHRGTKELDWVIGRYAEKLAPSMSESEMDLFERFLTVPDPEIHAWIMTPGIIPLTDFSGIIRDIKAFHGIGH